MRSIISRGLITLLTLLATGCATIEKQIDTIKPSAELLGTRLTNINFEGVDLVFDVAVTNRNPFSLRVAGLDYEIVIAENSLISGVMAQGLKLKKSSVSKVAVPVTLKFDDLKQLPGELWKGDEFEYHVFTDIHLNLPVIGKYTIPVSAKGELPVPKMPSVRMQKVRVVRLNLASADIVADIEIDNPNAFGLGLKNFNYKLDINQQTWGQGTGSIPNSIPQKSTGTIRIPLTLNLLTMGQSVYQLLNGDQRLNYQLSGAITIDTGLNFLRAYQMPLNISGTTDLR
jgi:LEA14-like dessication related protein